MRCVIVPAKIMCALGGGVRISAVASYAGEKVETTVMPAGGGRGRLTVSMDFLRPVELDVGDRLEVNLTRSTGPREAAVSPDLQRAFRFHTTAREAFDAAPASVRRWMVRYLEEARRAETREARVERILERLRERRGKHANP